MSVSDLKSAAQRRTKAWWLKAAGRPALSISIAVALVVVLAVAVIAATFDLRPADTKAQINGAWFIDFNPADPSGSGTFDAFVRLGGGNVIRGYNTSYRPLEFDENNSGQFTKDILLSAVPTYTYEGATYREFQLDINQISGAPNAYLSLDEVEVYTTDVKGITGYPFVGKATLIYDMDDDEDNVVFLNYNNNTGSGKRDLRVLIPDSLFGSDPNCDYGAQGCTTYVVLYSMFGNTEYPNNDGYEEWGVAVYNTVTGYKWHDLNGDGIWDKNEPGLGGWQICAQKLVSGAPSGDPICDQTLPNGRYALGLTDGTYRIYEVCPANWAQTFPAPTGGVCGSGVYNVTVANGARLTDRDFGNFEPKPDIDVSKTCVAAAFVGQEIEYGFWVKNTGNVPLTGVVVTDPTIGLTWNVGTLAANEEKTTTVKYTPTAPGKIENTVTAEGTYASAKYTDTAKCTTMVYAPTVRKTAAGAYGERHTWTVVKTVNPTSQNAFAGDTVSYEWTVTVSEVVTEENFAVTGKIYVENPAPIAMTVSLSDKLDDNTVATIGPCVDGVWSAPNLTVQGGKTAVCDYTAAPTTKNATKNIATITLFGKTYSGEATINWVKTEINPTVTLDDDQNPDFPKTISDGGTWKYKENYTCSTDAALYAGDWTYTFGEKNLAQVKAGATVLSQSEASTAVNCWMIDVSKTANTTFKRTWQWTIEKRVTPAAWKLFDGDSGTSAYEIVVTKTGYVDSDWAVSGKITIVNPAPIPAPITAVVDTLPGATDLTLNCPWLGTPIPAGGKVECTYSAKLPNGDPRTNTATVSMPNKTYTATAPVTFGAPTTVVNDKITVKDGAMEWEFTASGSAKYNKKFTCADVTYTDNYGKYEWPNTATIKETGQSSSAKVTVECWKLDVKKDAKTSWKRYWSWTIDKVGDQTALTLMPGEVFLVNYEVTVNATYVDKDFAVAGVITVKNPAPIAAVINSVADVISPAIAPTVDCGVTFPYTLAGGGTLTCSYESALPNADKRLNTATVVQQNYDYDKDGKPTAGGTSTYTATADVIFSAKPTDEIDECIDVSDSVYGNLGTVCAADAPKTFKYSLEIGPYSLEQCGMGPYEFTNCADFVTNDTETTGEDCWTVTVTVPCPGCTYTQGYWKTHSYYGPAPWDEEGWAALGDFDGDGTEEAQDEQLFWPGADYTWYKVFWTAPKGGNAWYILAHQFMAAYLNVANGAGAPPTVAAALAEAYTLLQNNNPATFKDWKGSAAAKRMIELAYILDQYNNGYLGVPHCD